MALSTLFIRKLPPTTMAHCDADREWRESIPLVFIRNLLIFNTIQPYNMPASTLPLAQNITDFIYSVLLDLSASWRVAELSLSSTSYQIALISL